MSKVDLELGLKVRDHLVKLGIETPMTDLRYSEPYTDRVKHQIEDITRSMTSIMHVLKLDLNDDSLIETPSRIGKMFVNELFKGLDYNNFPKLTVVDNKMQYDEFVIERNVQVKSTCEHHFMRINGTAVVAYKPAGKVVGLSKMNRVVDFFSRRPQIQERLTLQIAKTLEFLLQTEDVAVIIDAEHACVRDRGIEDPCADTVTSYMGGIFRKDSLAKQELLTLINGTSIGGH